MNKLLQIYLTVVATFIMLFMAAILIAVIFVGVKLSQEIKTVQTKADGLSGQVDSFNKSIDNLNSSIKKLYPF